MQFLSFIQPSCSWKIVLFWSWWCRASLTVVSLEFYTRSASKSFPWAPKDVILLMSPDLFVLYGPGSWQYERIQGTGASKQTLQHPLARTSRNLLSSEKQNIGMQMVRSVAMSRITACETGTKTSHQYPRTCCYQQTNKSLLTSMNFPWRKSVHTN